MLDNHLIKIRRLTKNDDEEMALLIAHVSNEFGLSAEQGYGVSDLAHRKLTSFYVDENSAYFVLEVNNKIVGGAGIAPITTDDNRNICELQKMYFLSHIRGQGLGKQLAEHCLNFAKSYGFTHCYLETTEVLDGAFQLYLKLGFEVISTRLGNTGHSSCEIWMLKQLN